MRSAHPARPTALATPAPLTPTRRTSHPLRIAVVGTSRYPIRQPFAGGLEALVWHLVARLRARGHEVTLFAGEGSDGVDGEFASYAFPARGWEPSGTAARDQSMPERAFMSDHHAYLRLLMGLAGPLAGRFDVIHNHSLHHLPLVMAPLLDTPMLTTLHTPPTPWLESAIHATPDSVGPPSPFAAVSAYIARQWRVLRAFSTPAVVTNGVDLDAWRVGPGGDALAWSGRLVPEKAPHLAIEAARTAGMRLVIAGPMSDLTYFERAIRPHLGRTVEYAGHLAVPDLARLVGSSAAVLVTPLWDEPYGLVVAEALACGTPVVAFERGGIPEVVGDRSVGTLVRGGDVTAMAMAVSDTVGLDRSGVRAYAERYLSVERMVMAYEKAYQRLSSDASVEADRTA